MSEDKRSITFWISERPLTSKRVSRMLSDPEEGRKLAALVRASRAKLNEELVDTEESVHQTE